MTTLILSNVLVLLPKIIMNMRQLLFILACAFSLTTLGQSGTGITGGFSTAIPTTLPNYLGNKPYLGAFLGVEFQQDDGWRMGLYAEYLNSKHQATYYKEDVYDEDGKVVQTDFNTTIIPISYGVDYNFIDRAFHFYLGADLNAYFILRNYEEKGNGYYNKPEYMPENNFPISFGLSPKIGTGYEINTNFYIDLFLKYDILFTKMQNNLPGIPQMFRVSLGVFYLF